MRVNILSTSWIEPWDYTNPDGQGIGGSETCAIELAWRLARRGHEVVSYAPVPWDGERVWRDTTWTHYKNTDFSRGGVWLLFRNPEMLDHFPEDHPGQYLIQVNQDTWYPDASIERYAKLDRCICLCRDHAKDYGAKWPSLKGKIRIARNGIRDGLVMATLSNPPQRDPYKIVYCSSPDRGMKNAIAIVDRVHEVLPQVRLHVYYGWDNIDKMKEQYPEAQSTNVWQQIKLSTLAMMKGKDWIVDHGRIPQPELYREISSAASLLYPTSFSETGCITVMEAAALGAIPITNPIWALRDYVLDGVYVEGNPDRDYLVRQRYVGEVLRLMSDAGIVLQDRIRQEMMPKALEMFSWEAVCDIYESIISELAVDKEQVQEAIA